ncbi:60S ribosomal protein L7 [Trypanosoma brucei equiperdum]|uniref:60S ribosomal protein L7 n=1 Tax=Trypanosoma brucei equiperdum TaxID=630700 RepID=A0A3L6KYR8_9TRYP|nr:60S ribosomal protein L7 [Trypanosoma brucei equiperdum]
MGKNPPKWLPGERVKETILLQRKSVEQLRVDRVLRRDKLQERRERHKAKIDAKRKRKLSTKKFISAQTILKRAQLREKQGRLFQKIGEKATGKKGRMGEEEYGKALEDSRVVLIVRARGKLIPHEVALAFGRLGLRKLYSARLLCLNPFTDPLVKQLGPFSVVGHPEPAQLNELLRTRGALWNEETKTKRLINGNLMLEKALGEYNVLCIEDLCDVIINKTEHVRDVLKHIAPFDFHPPRQLFMERHRNVYQKMEIMNKESFAAYLAQELKASARREKRAVGKRKAVEESSQSSQKTS